MKDSIIHDDKPDSVKGLEIHEPFVTRRIILRKIDLYLLPIVSILVVSIHIKWSLMPTQMFVTYGLQALDKALLGYAAAYSLRTDTHLEEQQYSWVASIFYFGYLIFEYPLANMLHRFTTARFLGFMVFSWGLVVLCMNFATSFAGLATTRFLLGALESAVAPAFVVLTAQWFSPAEQPLRQNIWFAATPTFGMIGGLLGYAVGHVEHSVVKPWRLLFIIFGSTTVVWGVILFFIFPDSPVKARFLTEQEREIAAEHIANQGTGSQRTWKWSQVREAFTDVKTWIFFAIGLANTIPAGGLSSFASLLIKGFGFSAINTQLLTIPSHFIQVVCLIGGGMFCNFVPDMRLYLMAYSQVPSIIGTVLLHVLDDNHTWGRVVGLWLNYTHSASLAVGFSVIGGNVAGFAKKTTVTVLLFCGYCVGNIAAPQFFLDEESEEGYPTAITAMLVCYCLTFVLPFLLRWLYCRENKRRDALPPQHELTMVDDDCTDLQKRDFRYVL
jgi:ACS family allantoate permease-like MFS transporter